METHELQGRIRAVLGGGSDRLAGLTFVADEAIAGLRWGRHRSVRLLEAACSTLAPDFIFVPSGHVWSDEAVDRVLGCGTEVFWVVDGVLGRVAEARGWSDVLRETATHPDTTAARFDETMTQALESVRRGVRLGACAVVIADDLGGASGPLVAPDFAFEQVIPRLGVLAREAIDHGAPALVHSDGDVRVFLSAFAHEGFVAVHPGGIKADALTALHEGAQRHGLALLGGMTGEVLRVGGPAVLRAAADAALLAEHGGLLFADDGGISTPVELVSMVTAIQEFRRGA